MIKPDEFILASGSKSRLALLHSIGLYPSKILPPDIEEVRQKSEKAPEMAKRLSLGKCKKIAETNPNALIIAADTVSISKGRIMDKTFDEKIAREYLDIIKGKRHKLFTAMCVAIPSHNIFKQIIVQSVLQFKNMTSQEIDDYIATGEWKGCSGAYRIEGYIARYLKFISGSYSNILGLPVYDLHQVLSSLNVDLSSFKTTK